MKRNGDLNINGMIRDVRQEIDINQYPLFNQEITESIIQSRAIAASDVSIKDGKMGRAWIVMKNNGQEVLFNRLYHKKWADNSSKSAEVIILLELVQVIVKKSKHIQYGKIIIALDCREVY